MKKIYALTRFAMALFLVAVLMGCYMPIRFDAEIENTGGGYYDFKFDGYMVKVELFKGLKEGKIKSGEEKNQIGIIERDFGRDASVKEFKYLKMDHFKVYWDCNGGPIKARSVKLPRSADGRVRVVQDPRGSQRTDDQAHV